MKNLKNIFKDVLDMNNINENLSKENSLLKNEIRKLKKENESLKFNSSNFQEFLAKTYVNPKIMAPFSKEDKQAFAIMDYIGKYLRNIVSKSEFLPLVTIIMPTYNRRNVIPKAIESILNQTYKNFEFLIIDDASEDETVEYLNTLEDNRIKILCNDENKGGSFSRNVCLDIAKGDIIMYLDSDNMWDSKYIETIVGAYIRLPDADAIYSGQLIYKDFNSKPHAFRFGPFNKLLLHNRNFIDINCFCHKKYTYKEVGGFNEDLWRLEDWEYILRTSNKFKLYSIPVLLSKYYEHDFEDRISNMPFKVYETCKPFLEKNKIPIKKYNPLEKKISIIIPNYESLEEIKNCINSIFSFNFGDKVDIIVVDYSSSSEVLEYLSKAESEGKIKLILNSINDESNLSIKKGIDMSDINSDLLFLKSDTIITEGAIEHMQDCAYSIPNCGLVVPHEMTLEKNNIIKTHVPYADLNMECDTLPSILNHNIINIPIFHDGGLLELNYAPFFCTYVKREIYDKTANLEFQLGIDDQTNHIFSDFIHNILKLKIYQSPNSFVYHKHLDTMRKIKNSDDKLLTILKDNEIKTDFNTSSNHKKALWDY